MKTNKLIWVVFGIALFVSSFAVAVEPVSPSLVDSVDRYSAYYSATQSGTALKSTLQLPVGASKRAYLEGVTIESSVACSFTIEMSGTAATTTAFTVRPLNTSTASQALAYGASNVGTGVVITGVTLSAGDVRTVALSGIALASGAGSTHNITVVPSCTTGDIKNTWKFAHIKGV